ncbi:MAG TPA: tetratricopeptide repeat protein [Chryseolinea sp.]|nr:tetratricopeptide repeat protein [Chryseolinea sp.]
MNKFSDTYKRKAATLVCLFLFLSCTCWGFPSKSSFSSVEEWKFDEPTHKAYELVLNLQLDEVHQLIPEPETAHQHYVVALAEALELLITEDGEKYTEYEDRFINRLERRTRVNVPDDLFLQAEIRMHWTFVYLKFGHEFDAALNLRQAYLTIEEIRNKFPKFKAINKTSGLLEVIIGSVPQKYNWVLSLLNMEGSTRAGLGELQAIRLSDSPLAFEASLIHALIQGFLLQQPGAASSEINALRATHPRNRLALFLGSALAMKNNQSENALVMLDSLSRNSVGLPLYYADYLRGEIYLFKGEYLNSISSYRWFINHYNGQNGVKDAYYKIGLCYWLNGNTNDAAEIFKQAKSRGKEASEADKYAARSLAETELPHINLTKARYAIDGGYYEQAKQILESLEPQDIPTKRDQVEYFYRKARLSHKLNDVDTAKFYYLRSIDLSGDEEWYYAPNACLQLGYIFWSENDDTLARSYFNRAMSYSKHEYKNSIDSKAKSAIAQIKRK